MFWGVFDFLENNIGCFGNIFENLLIEGFQEKYNIMDLRVVCVNENIIEYLKSKLLF